ncbi:MAG: hypothetical protein H0Z32_15345 [Bacillaceae bacterium]|nr:hypothetical protein [Bacillaceae bacterium]
MYCCLVLHHSTITNETKLQMLKAVFQGMKHVVKPIKKGNQPQVIYEIFDDQTVLALCDHIDKEKLLQTAIYFESSDVKTSYGMGETREGAKQEAIEKLKIEIQY